jgi:photosystem II stability/assembly factor-like uncharacterized protein
MHDTETQKFFLFSFLFSMWWTSGGIVVSSALAQEQLARLPVNLYGVSFLTPEEGWVVGQFGKIFHTTDGGKRWEEQHSGVDTLLTAVNFVDRTHGWVVGERGVILHTTDGGASWRTQPTGVPYPLFAVKFLDRNTGWVVGHWGTILFTADGGNQWVERSLSVPLEESALLEPAALHDITDPTTGEVLAKAGQLLSKELISTIRQRGLGDVHSREDVVLNSVFFFDHAHGWIGGERGLVLRTEDGGQTWERILLPRPPTRGQEAAGGGEKLALGEEVSEAELEAFGLMSPLPSVYSLFFVSPREGWAVGQEGTIARTYDGGRQWELQPSGTREALYDVGVGRERGWIIGDRGTVLISTDRGARWNQVNLGLEARSLWLRQLAVAGGDLAFFVGADGLVLASNQLPEDRAPRLSYRTQE